MFRAYGALWRNDRAAGSRVTNIALVPVTDFAALGDRWRALEAQADCSFFQSWTWTGCLAEERFPDPVLLEARQDGETVALALFNRRRFAAADAAAGRNRRRGP